MKFTDLLSTLFMIVGTGFILLLPGCDADHVTSQSSDGFVKRADGTELYYKLTGMGQDTLVVVHGGPGAGMFTVLQMTKPLVNEFTLIFYDQRGGGRSTLPEDTTQLQPHHFVEDLEAVRKHFALEQMNVIAHSFGSILVAEYAKKYPRRLRRMVFHGATGPRRSDAGKYYRAQAEAAAQSPDTALSKRASELLQSLLDGTASEPLVTCREYEEISRQILISRGDSVNYQGTTCEAPPEAIRYYYRYTAQLAPRYFGDWDYMDSLEEVTAPLLVIYGERETPGIPMQKQWIDAVPDGRLILVPEAGKGAFFDNPDAAFPVVEEFFRGKGDQASG